MGCLLMALGFILIVVGNEVTWIIGLLLVLLGLFGDFDD